ncbi:YihY/virulence factor BrkB family protein [Miltoncostaea marina]|uniref:YihY/virulence factor BrkB family protein n=1 Tax=Miltoncostaea marina TaxID=2843215 RepID=UPI001C3C3A74|nr:YihY/virulence factor BrkB family protein [Miltoncostaea marina]
MRRGLLIGAALAALLAALPDRRRPAPPAAPPAPPAAAGPAAPPAPAAPATRWAGAREVLVTAVRRGLKGNVTDVAASLAYYAFLAVPATLLVAVGLFGLFAGPGTIRGLLDRVEGVVPEEAIRLIDDTLTRVVENSGGGLGLAVLGLALALWTSSGAMSALVRGLNRVHGRPEDRPFARQRLTALALLGFVMLAVVVSFGLLVLGAPLSRWLGEELGAETLVGWLWWGAQWPILAGALLVAVAGILRAGPAGRPNPPRAVTAGAGVAVAIWIVASAGFSVYVSRFGSYGAAWGSLSAVIVMLTWLWLTGLALLLGAEVEAEVTRRAAREAVSP